MGKRAVLRIVGIVAALSVLGVGIAALAQLVSGPSQRDLGPGIVVHQSELPGGDTGFPDPSSDPAQATTSPSESSTPTDSASASESASPSESPSASSSAKASKTPTPTPSKTISPKPTQGPVKPLPPRPPVTVDDDDDDDDWDDDGDDDDD
ncbi:hypothetical protein [Glutamicibacter sp. NPDC087344]|uniref:hypothetical protein n=1 Tax=Glutamicibacter sp. NPDC087344 TaxID=3363994 RepID=UPI0038189D2A